LSAFPNRLDPLRFFILAFYIRYHLTPSRRWQSDHTFSKDLSKKWQHIFIWTSNIQWRNKEEGKWGHAPRAQILRVHQHTLQ